MSFSTKDHCRWKQTDKDEWYTSCSNICDLLTHTETPTGLDMEFCCYCGKPLKESPLDEQIGT